MTLTFSRFLYLSLFSLGFFLSSVQAENLGFIRYFDDGMVLQQGKTVTVRGYAKADADVKRIGICF